MDAVPLFLFNYFHATDFDVVPPVSEYTAVWFQQNTSLKDPVPVRPLKGESRDHALINHGGSPNFRTFLPHLILRPSFRTFVLANVSAYEISAEPLLYRRWVNRT